MSAQEPQWQSIYVDEEVYHFLRSVAAKEGVETNQVLRSMIFGEKMDMSAEAREALARHEEAYAQVDLRDPEAMARKRDELRRRV